MVTETLRDTSFRDLVIIVTISLYLLVAQGGRDVVAGSLSHKKESFSVSHRALNSFSILRKHLAVQVWVTSPPLGLVTVAQKRFVIRATWIIGPSWNGIRFS